MSPDHLIHTYNGALHAAVLRSSRVDRDAKKNIKKIALELDDGGEGMCSCTLSLISISRRYLLRLDNEGEREMSSAEGETTAFRYYPAFVLRNA